MLGRLIGEGRQAEVYNYSKTEVVKLFKSHVTRDMVNYEWQISSNLFATGMPMPRVDKIIEVAGRLGIVFAKIEGPSLLQLILSGEFPVEKTGNLLAKLHQKLHQVHTDQLPSLKTKIINSVSSLAMIPSDLKNDLLHICNQLPEDNSVCHGDFHPDNIIISPKGPVIIDWVNATAGNALADVARTHLLISNSRMPDSIKVTPEIQNMRNKLADYYLNCYLENQSTSFTSAKKELHLWSEVVAAVRLAEEVPGETDTLITYIKNLRDELDG